jgi:ribonucleoside-diphosphate reductase alpha chain
MTKAGPRIPIAIWADEQKYRQEGETFSQKCGRVAGALTDNQDHFRNFKDILEDQRFLPGGRVQSAAGSYRRVTAFNCFVMKKVPDDLMGIMDVAKEAAKTMQLGGGVGYDFSHIRPKGSRIKSLGSQASGPVSFMGIMDALCKTIASAGHRRGAQMGCLRVDHPDIAEFITAKTNDNNLTQFNVSVLVTDKFMEAVRADTDFDLVFEGRVFDTVRARSLWDTILRATWDWAEPGVIFIDRVNKMNNLWYLEDISATNPCGEQPLPEYGACLLGSFNLTRYVDLGETYTEDTYRAPGVSTEWQFDWDQLDHDIPHVVRAMDNVVDETTYPLYQQEVEAKNKRRMGLGVTGLGNVLGALGIEYGSKEAQEWTNKLLRYMANRMYMSSVELAIEKGPFPAFDAEKYCQGEFIKKLDQDVQDAIRKHGIRNSHLTSIAPTGTISLTANNVSSGLEPVFSHSYQRTVQTASGPIIEQVEDYAYREWGIKCKTADQVTVQEHVAMLTAAQEWIDSACSKTCNVGANVTWDEFKDVYMQAYLGGAKGCTTFRAAGKRFGILNASASEDVVETKSNADETTVEGGACYIDVETGIRTCDSI